MRTVFLDFDSLHPSDLDTAAFESRLENVDYWSQSQPKEIVSRLKDAEVAVVNKLRLGAEEFAQLPQLKLICLAATGSDNIDLDAARENAIAVANIRDYCSASVAQHVFTLLLTLNQKLDTYRTQVNGGQWSVSVEFCLLEPTFTELDNKILGIVGYGTLGRRVAAIGNAFGMRVMAASRAGKTAKITEQNVQPATLEQIFSAADVISLHCPLNSTTENLINEQALNAMQQHALLINTARGGLIDSVALVKALSEGHIAGAAVDVLREEPPVNGDPLLSTQLPNLIVTPHMAWAAREARQRALDQILSNIESFAAGNGNNHLI